MADRAGQDGKKEAQGRLVGEISVGVLHFSRMGDGLPGAMVLMTTSGQVRLMKRANVTIRSGGVAHKSVRLQVDETGAEACYPRRLAVSAFIWSSSHRRAP